MAVSLKQNFFILLVLVPLAGCSLIPSGESPSSWGEGAGKAGSKMWVDKYGDSGYPSSESVATFCVDISEEGMQKFGWNYEQALESSDACSKSFVDGLS